MNHTITKIFVFVTCVLAVSCSNTKHLPAGESLFLGARVTIKDNEAPKKDRKVLKTDLQKAVRPTPNTKTLGMRIKLAIYNFAGEPKKKKGLRYWLRTKVGEAPSLASQFDMAKTKDLFKNLMENRGFFFPEVTGSVTTKNKKTWADFDVKTGFQYRIRNVQYVRDSTALSDSVAKQQNRTLLKKDAPYNLDLIKGERTRIDRRLKQVGYYYFKPDYLLVQADTFIGNHQVDMYMKVKDDIPQEAREQYRIKDVFIFPDYRLGMNRNGRNRPNSNIVTDTLGRPLDTIFYKRYYIVGHTNKYKPTVFTQAMQFQPGELYNMRDHNTSLNRLVNMGVFKFVKNSFEPVGNNQLNAYYYLTSHPKKSLRAEIGALTKNDSRAGSEISLSWRNRNTFKGAELLAIKANVGFEAQSGGGVSQPPTYQFGLEPSLTIPRFVTPFFHPTSSSLFVPHTKISVSYDILLRSNLYDLRSFKTSYGFIWKENIKSEHQFFPLNFVYVRTDTLNKDTTLNINYGNLVFNGVILGPTYEYTYNSRGNRPPHHHDIYFDGLADLSANILGLVQGTDINKNPGDAPKQLLGAAYAQYVKLQADFRYYMNYSANPNSIWANRIMIGYGLPYGNSTQLPNIKQFFSGGSSSLRGFPSRLVGPGRFYFRDASGKQLYFETYGDIKLELNSELRAQLINFVHGAIFIDAGNVWTYRPITQYPGGAFTSNFYKDFAVDVGAGLRFDFKILVVRLDLGMPVRKPWMPAGQEWAYNNLDFGNSEWRRENLVLNIGIGYPF